MLPFQNGFATCAKRKIEIPSFCLSSKLMHKPTFGVAPRTFPARASPPCTFPKGVNTQTMQSWTPFTWRLAAKPTPKDSSIEGNGSELGYCFGYQSLFQRRPTKSEHLVICVNALNLEKQADTQRLHCGRIRDNAMDFFKRSPHSKDPSVGQWLSHQKRRCCAPAWGLEQKSAFFSCRWYRGFGVFSLTVTVAPHASNLEGHCTCALLLRWALLRTKQSTNMVSCCRAVAWGIHALTGMLMKFFV